MSTNIIITNHPVNRDEHIVKDLCAGWVVAYPKEKNWLGDVGVELEARVKNTHHYKTRRELSQLNHTFNLAGADWELWEQSNFEPYVLLLLLLTPVNTETDDRDNIPHYFREHKSTDMLSLIIPNCCACGLPERVVESVSRILSSWKDYPFGQTDFDIYNSGGDLGLAYMIDAQDKYIEHGSSIGGSWLTGQGVLLSLMFAMEMN